MKTAPIKSVKIKQMFNELHQNLGGSLNIDSEEYILELDNSTGNGQIKGIALEGGICYLEFDLTFFDDIEISTLIPGDKPIYFAYCAKGSLSHKFGKDGEERELNRFQTGILTSKQTEDNILSFKKDIALKISLIVVNTMVSETSKKNTLNGTLRSTFFKNDEEENFVYIGSLNLKIAEKIEQLDAIAQTGIVICYRFAMH